MHIIFFSKASPCSHFCKYIYISLSHTQMTMDELLTNPKPKLGGRKTFPFITASAVSVGMGAYAVISNLGVYLIEQYNVLPVNTTVIGGVVTGSTNLAPIVGAIVSDTCLSCFTVVTIACAASSLGMLLFTLTAALPFLRPAPCSSGPCEAPASWQFGILYIGIALMTIGLGGTRFTAATMGAAQFDDAGDQDTFFSWYVVGLYLSSIIGIAGIVYIQDNAGWFLGFGVCAAISISGLIIFLLGNRYYRHPEPEKNAFIDVLHSIVSRVKRRRPETSENLWHYSKLEDGATESQNTTESLSSSNVAVATEQVEGDDLSRLLRLTPLITTGIVLSVYLGVQMAISFFQALAMDRHLGPHFSVPLGSMSIFLVIAAMISIPLLDHVFYPAWRCLAGKLPTPLQRVGLGFLVTTLAMVYGAVVEAKRLDALQSSSEPMSVLWLVPCLTLVGLGEALHFPGQLAFFYQEFPASLKGSGTAVSALQSGIGSYVSSAVIMLIQRYTGWIQDNANLARIDKVYWMLAVIGMLNFGCFLVCARLYGKKK